MNRNLKTRANNGFTIIELIVVVTVIGLLVAIAVGAYNKGFHDAKVTKSLAFANTLATAKALFVADPKTTPALISTFNNGPNGNFAMIAPKRGSNQRMRLICWRNLGCLRQETLVFLTKYGYYEYCGCSA